MKKRFILIPILFFSAIATLMKLIWDSLSDTDCDTEKPYNLAANRVLAILKKEAENKNFTAEHLLEQLQEPRDILESALNCTLESFIQTYRLQLAEQLLRTTDDTISCIAETCGFGDSSRLYHPFHSHFGCSPTQYRENNRS